MTHFLGKALPPEPAYIPSNTLPKGVLSQTTASKRHGLCC